MQCAIAFAESGAATPQQTRKEWAGIVQKDGRPGVGNHQPGTYAFSQKPTIEQWRNICPDPGASDKGALKQRPRPRTDAAATGSV